MGESWKGTDLFRYLFAVRRNNSGSANFIEFGDCKLSLQFYSIQNVVAS